MLQGAGHHGAAYARPVVTRVRESYGAHPRQVADRWTPDGAPDLPLPTVVLVHGGFWRDEYDLTLEDAVAQDLAERGWLVWNVDYRPSSAPWPATLTDVAAAYDALGANGQADLRRTAVVGHSAGGHLALWLASRSRLPTGAPGASPALPPPALVVAQAPVAALADAAALRLGQGAAQALLGGEPAEVPDRLAVADPVALLPTGVPTLCVHAERDDRVPISSSEAYVAAAGADARLVRVAGGHFEHLDPGSEAVQVLRVALEELRRSGPPA